MYSEELQNFKHYEVKCAYKNLQVTIEIKNMMYNLQPKNIIKKHGKTETK